MGMKIKILIGKKEVINKRFRYEGLLEMKARGLEEIKNTQK